MENKIINETIEINGKTIYLWRDNMEFRDLYWSNFTKNDKNSTEYKLIKHKMRIYQKYTAVLSQYNTKTRQEVSELITSNVKHYQIRYGTYLEFAPNLYECNKLLWKLTVMLGYYSCPTWIASLRYKIYKIQTQILKDMEILKDMDKKAGE